MIGCSYSPFAGAYIPYDGTEERVEVSRVRIAFLNLFF